MPKFISEHASAYNYFCAFFVCFGSLLWGYDSAGGAIGCLLSAPIGNYGGRKGTMQAGAIVSIIGCTLQTAAFNTGMLCAGRVIAGLAIGIIYFAVPMYQSEIAPPEHRGSFVGLHAQFIGFGYALSNWIGFGVYFTKGPFTFRFPIGLQILWGVILLLGSLWLPESPRYLIEIGKNEEAFRQLERLRKKSDKDFLNREFKQMSDQINWEKENEISSLKGILTKPSYRKRLFLGCGVQIGQQICGISAINYYQTKMYESLGIKGTVVLALAGVWGLTGPLANIFCLTFMIDRIKRKTLLFWGSIAMTVDIAIVMIFVAIFGGGPNSVANGFGVFFLISFGIIFSLSWNSGCPVYCTEIFPTQIRAKGGAISTFWSFVIQIVLAQASPTALANVGYRYYIFFIVMNLLTAGLVWFLLPETMGKTLEEISEVFGDTFVTLHIDEDLKVEQPVMSIHETLGSKALDNSEHVEKA
ncbi:hypothetical protein IFR05_014557 [Cadophora sp. M221]|nr:hypothetical protein IFR05_014557 [Cadophora sp. M221]